jgi:hypothetical protein
MPLAIHSPHAAMGGEQVIRISNEDRPTDGLRFILNLKLTRPKRISCCETL